LGAGGFFFEPRDHADVLTAPRGLGHQSQRRPDLRRRARIKGCGVGIKVRRHYTDQRVGIAIQKNFLAEFSGIRGEAALPETVTNESNTLAVTAIFFLQEIAADYGMNAENA
jgi:hypothetical protein